MRAEEKEPASSEGPEKKSRTMISRYRGPLSKASVISPKWLRDLVKEEVRAIL
jgi:hypothetical protein